MSAAGHAARAASHAALQAILQRQRPLDEVWGDLARGPLREVEPRDRAFARLLIATTLRRLGQIDALLAHFLDRPLRPAAHGAQNALRLGLAQLLFLQTPAHAAVDGSVSLAGDAWRGLVNAVLRRAAREADALAAAQDAERLNTPDWLWNAWTQTYGEAAARRIAAAHLSEPSLDISVKQDAPGWAAKLDAELLPTGSLRRSNAGTVESLPGFADGAWWVQDAAAALPVRLFGDVAGRTVIDLCAAPGGKTAQLAALGAQAIAVDRSRSRLRLLEQNLQRLGLRAEIVAADATEWQPGAPADAVLLDAPCTATGTIRRHPDIPWLKGPDDLAKLASLQTRLLQAAVPMLTPGGALVYCTCSLQPEEGDGQVEALLAGGAPLERVPIRPDELRVPADAIDAAGALRTLPAQGMDGFYACRLRRV